MRKAASPQREDWRQFSQCLGAYELDGLKTSGVAHRDFAASTEHVILEEQYL